MLFSKLGGSFCMNNLVCASKYEFKSLRGQEFSRPGVQEARSSAGREFRRPGVPEASGSGVQEDKNRS